MGRTNRADQSDISEQLKVKYQLTYATGLFMRHNGQTNSDNDCWPLLIYWDVHHVTTISKVRREQSASEIRFSEPKVR